MSHYYLSLKMVTTCSSETLVELNGVQEVISQNKEFSMCFIPCVMKSQYLLHAILTLCLAVKMQTVLCTVYEMAEHIIYNGKYIMRFYTSKRLTCITCKGK
jgi:hypothetical protein